MIRRAANQVQTSPGQPTTIIATGWVLGWYIDGTAESGQSMKATFEENQHGFVSVVPLEQVQFQDGAPATIPTID